MKNLLSTITLVIGLVVSSFIPSAFSITCPETPADADLQKWVYSPTIALHENFHEAFGEALSAPKDPKKPDPTTPVSFSCKYGPGDVSLNNMVFYRSLLTLNDIMPTIPPITSPWEYMGRGPFGAYTWHCQPPEGSPKACAPHL